MHLAVVLSSKYQGMVFFSSDQQDKVKRLPYKGWEKERYFGGVGVDPPLLTT